MPTPTHASQYAIRGGSSSISRPTPGRPCSSANAGSMWPTAKIARAIVGEPPENSSTLQVDLRGGVEVEPPQRGRQQHRRHQRRPAAEARHVAVDRRLAGLDDHLAEQDDQEQAEALGEVVRIDRLGRVGGLERLQVVRRAQPAGGRAVLVQQAPDSSEIAIAHST